MKHFFFLRRIAVSLVATIVFSSAGVSQCGPAPSSGSTSIASTTPVNSYYPGTGNPAHGTSTVVVGTLDARGSSTPIAANDLVMIIQMQGADINSTNSDSYGNGIAGVPGNGYLTTNLSAGSYEYNSVQSVSGSTITLSYVLANSYFTQAYTSSTAIQSFQVIRVPRYYDVTIASGIVVTAPAWNGATGGVVVLDAVNTLNFAASSSGVSVTGLGFRGGGGKNFTGAASGIVNTDYRWLSPVTTAGNTTGGSKGEGIAGTPAYLPNSSTLVTITGTVEGYINGSMGRGAAGNAGGGATDGGPTSNQYNTGGGGGGNGGAGGNGGSGWDGTGGNAATYPYGGNGGAAFSQAALTRTVMGGGGGAGSANNSTAADEYYCSGGAGGGIIFMRAKSYSGSGTVSADGLQASDITIPGPTPPNQTDAAGGGGAGGTIVIVTNATGATGLGTVTASAKGGRGGNMTTYYSHGPGGGGGGGVIITNGTLLSTVTTGGAAGLTHTCCAATNPLTDVYGSTAGGTGSLLTLASAPPLTNAFNFASPCGVLPIVLKEFKAVAVNQSSVLLSWSVEQQINFSHFIVQYSDDGVHFNNVGTIAFDNNFSYYEFTYAQTAASAYYRLKLVDKDGSFTYSPLLSVRLAGQTSSKVSVYPNPFVKNITLSVNATITERSNLQLLDNAGRLHFQRSVNLVKGQNFISLPEADALPAGLYHLRLSIHGSVVTENIVKQ